MKQKNEAVHVEDLVHVDDSSGHNTDVSFLNTKCVSCDLLCDNISAKEHLDKNMGSRFYSH